MKSNVNVSKIRAKGKRLNLGLRSYYSMNEVAFIWAYYRRLKSGNPFASFNELCFWLTDGYGRIFNNDFSSVVVESGFNLRNWNFLQQQKEMDLGLRTSYTCGKIR